MKTIEQRLADALRTVIDTASGGVRANEADNITAKREGILALAAYDAQQMAAPGNVRVDGKEIVGHDWDNGPQAWDVVRTDGEEWLCFADPEHSARIVQCINAHDGLVAALSGVDEMCQAGLNSGKPEHVEAALNDALGMARAALAAAGVTP